MNKQQVYEQWLMRKRDVGVPEEIAERVMTVLSQDARPRRVSMGDHWIVTRLAQAGLAAGALMVFLIRFVMLFTAAVG